MATGSPLHASCVLTLTSGRWFPKEFESLKLNGRFLKGRKTGRAEFAGIFNTIALDMQLGLQPRQVLRSFLQVELIEREL